MKTNLDKFFKTSETLEKNGVWYMISDDIGFLVKPFKATNPSVKAALANYHKPHARQIELGTLPTEKLIEIQVKLFVNACVLDWKGVEIDGELVPYSKEKAIPFFIALPDLFETLWNHCQDFKNYQEEEELGNFSAED